MRRFLIVIIVGLAILNLNRPINAQSIPTVFLILMENHNWAEIKNSPSAPYINKVLLPMASSAEQYYNPPGVHPSEPNYLWLEAGTDFGVRNDDDPHYNHFASPQHLVTLLDSAGIPWHAYEEGITGKECPLVSAGRYAAKHNPMVFFDDVTDTNRRDSPYCISHIRPYSELTDGLAGNHAVTGYNFITPDECDDMHSACPTMDTIKNGDTWLSNALPALLNSDAYKNGAIILITWDEGEGGDGPIGMIVLSTQAKGGGYTNQIHYTHSSTLRTIQEIFGVTPLLGDAANATDLSDLFTTFATPQP
jgi:hypothetical protein